jgi:hypothetical protein
MSLLINLNSRIVNPVPIVNRAAFNAALLASASPFLCGVIDAETDRPNQAADRFSKEGDIAEYNEGYSGSRRMMAAARGKADFATGAYNPPSWAVSNEYDAYVRAWNDASAEATGRTTWQQAR